MQDYIAEDWKTCLQRNGLRAFEDFWNLKEDWFEPPNQRRGGWSGVVRTELNHPAGGKLRVFIKRQENHVTKTWQHPLRGVPTVEREFKNILRYHQKGIPSLVPVYYAQRRQNGNCRAVLVTEELSGFRSLEDYMREWNATKWPSPAVKRTFISAVAELLRHIHRHHLRHHCFFPKHILLRFNGEGQLETRIIDLEKTKWKPWVRGEDSRDLRNLASDSVGWSRTDRLRFLKLYLQVDRLSPRHKTVWRKIHARLLEKGRVPVLPIKSARDATEK